MNAPFFHAPQTRSWFWNAARCLRKSDSSPESPQPDGRSGNRSRIPPWIEEFGTYFLSNIKNFGVLNLQDKKNTVKTGVFKTLPVSDREGCFSVTKKLVESIDS